MPNAQNLASLNGKILRMTPAGAVPADNPFTNSLVYSYGHRNVQGLAWDAQGRMWAAEFGQNTWDEINQIVAGGNYGWPTVEGMTTDTRFRNPAVVWSTAEASPSGLAYANNTLFAAALRGTRLWTVPLTNGTTGTPVAELQGQFGRLRTVMLGPDGWLWVATSNRDGRGTPVAADDRVLRFPPVTTTPTSTPPATVTPTTPPMTTPPVTSPPVTSPPVTSTGQPPAGGCTATFSKVSEWQGNFQGEILVRNTATTTRSSWTVTFTFPNGQTISQLWGGTFTQSGAAVTIRNETWNGTLAPNATATAGFLATWTGVNNPPTALTCR